jgi:phospholipid/cholesterol/gamma-HCH transport system substrate-binding protein
MKNIFSTEFYVGLTVTTATLILIFGIIWGKEFRLRTNKIQIQIVFDEVGGMVPGDPVTVNGVKEGKVLEIGWKDRKVLCTAELNNYVQLYEDARFIVISAELLAGMKIEIYPGKSGQKINMAQQPFEGSYAGRVVDVALVIAELSQNLKALSNRIDTTVSYINSMLKPGVLQNDLTVSLANIREITAQLRPLPGDVKRTISGLDTAVTDIQSLIKTNSGSVTGIVQNLNNITAQLDTVSISLHTVMTRIGNNEGTLGKMVNEKDLYDHLNRTLLSVDSLANAIKNDGLKLDLF